MIPVREKQSFDPQPWDGTENKLPGICENGGYFLKSGAGDKWVVGGTVIRPLATRKETADRFSIYAFELSSYHEGKGLKGVKFEETHHAFYTEAGTLKFVIDGVEAVATAGETTFLPAGTTWTVEAESVYAKGYVFANGGGYGEAAVAAGEKYDAVTVPQTGDAVSWEESKLKGVESELKFLTI